MFKFVFSALCYLEKNKRNIEAFFVLILKEKELFKMKYPIIVEKMRKHFSIISKKVYIWDLLKDNLEKVKQQKKKGQFIYFDDNGESYIKEEEIRLETVVGVKISVEKYMRKLRHQENEVDN